MTTLADFLGLAPGGGSNRLPCQACGTWTCASCGWQRHGASLHYPGQCCARCGSSDGAFTRTLHHKRWKWEDHNPASGPSCLTWNRDPYESFTGPCEHLSCQVIAWGHVYYVRSGD